VLGEGNQPRGWRWRASGGGTSSSPDAASREGPMVAALRAHLGDPSSESELVDLLREPGAGNDPLAVLAGIFDLPDGLLALLDTDPETLRHLGGRVPRIDDGSDRDLSRRATDPRPRALDRLFAYAWLVLGVLLVLLGLAAVATGTEPSQKSLIGSNPWLWVLGGVCLIPAMLLRLARSRESERWKKSQVKAPNWPSR
jgi:hypothetical protein